MDIQTIQQEVSKVAKTSYAKHSDRQLEAYETLHQLYSGQNKGIQPVGFKIYNNPANRVCKLSLEDVRSIRNKYIPRFYGKEKLAKEFGVSKSVILRIIRGESWRVT
jgi:hypothetical protein